MDKFNSMMNSYSSNKRNPQIFAPDELDRLLAMIQGMRKELLDIYHPLEASCRDLGYILGWGYDTKVLSAILNTRAHILKFIALSQIQEPFNMDHKRAIVEQYLNIEGSVTFWTDRLAKKARIGAFD